MYQIYLIQTFADKTPRWTQFVDLSGARYKLYISWNTMQTSWYMTIFDIRDTILLGGIRLVPGIDLLKKYRASVPELPHGFLSIIDKESDPKTAELTRDNFGKRFVLAYEDIGE